MAIEFKFKGADDKTLKRAIVPESWEEVTLRQLINMSEQWSGSNADVIELLAALTSEKYDDLASTKSNIWIPVLSVLDFLFEDPPKWDKLKAPKKIRLNDRWLEIPKDLGLERFGQKVLAVQMMETSKEEKQLHLMPKLIALYLQPKYDGKYIAKRMDTLERYVMELPALHAVPIGNFFFHNLWKPKNYGLTGLHPFLLVVRKSIPAKLRKLKDLTNSAIYN